MGSNIHIQRGDRDKPLRDWPDALGTGPDSCTMPRSREAYEFMKVLWKQECDVVERCTCKGEHDYYCDRDSICRPKDFQLLRMETCLLDPVFEILIDYLESEPNAYLEYD